MSSVQLLVLGALRRRGRAHGYQVRADLEAWGAHEWARASSGSVYYALRAMANRGWLVTHTAPSQAGGPPRIEYQLTETGESEYLRLLAGALVDREPGLDVLGAAIGLIEDLPRDKALRLLRQRAQAMSDWRAAVLADLPPDVDLSTWGPVGEVIGFWLTTAEAGAHLSARLIARLEEGAFTMAGEAPPRASAATAYTTQPH